MANKVSTVIAALMTGLQGLVTAGTLRGVTRGVYNPVSADEATLPRAAVMVGDLRPESGPPGGETWKATVYVYVTTLSSAAAKDLTLLDLVSAVNTVLATVRAGGASGGAILSTHWEVYPFRDTADPEPLQAVCAVQVRIDGGLAA